jgi:UDP-3-O-[3-hydroxymyristoyl] glucosamine N-acyltransferase
VNTPDPRFFETLAPTTLGALAQMTGAQCDPAVSDRPISTVAILARAEPGSVSFLTGRKFADAAAATKATACFVGEKDAALLPDGCVALISRAPHAAWAMAAQSLHRPLRLDAAAPAIHPDAKLEEGVSVGSGAVIGAGAEIGSGTDIGPNAVIGRGVAIGRNCEIGPGAVIRFALIGDRVKIAANVVIGEPGFGVAAGPLGLLDIPQLGRVILQDAVSIGAHTCVDRGAFDDTVIGENTKIDNLVQIAHNVVIGRNTVIAGLCGLSGSCVVGDGVQIGGQVGLADHVMIGNGARIGATSGVMHEVPAGQSWLGTPARPVLQFFREVAWLTRAAGRKGGGGQA